ncbi:hypothetical protein [Flavisolibacter tropicus]|uniref:Uncharacterized protein n=1 Tax=Flavisolibacter tropicus TaxID=1492898 RepID=A0A172TWD0_9BACT|nr:hypothetical protein [Flavisolibacter tropicus]ANE51268.1 hypothetical protein SY85_12870 [Flavisolibacter tropicus]
MSAIFLQHNSTYQTYEKTGEAGLRKNTAQQADQNDILAMMGGVEKVSKMSEAEAQTAAMAAYQKKMASTTAGPAANANMNELTQSMKDPKSRAKLQADWNNMSEEERKAFVRSNTAETIPTNNAQYAKVGAQKNKANQIMNITQALAAIQQEVININTYYSQQEEAFHQKLQPKRDSLNKWYYEKYVPALGKGSTNDPVQYEKYKQELEQLAKKETNFKVTSWQEQYAKIKPIVASFENKYIAGRTLGMQPDEDQYIANVTNNLIGVMDVLASQASQITPRVQE